MMGSRKEKFKVLFILMLVLTHEKFELHGIGSYIRNKIFQTLVASRGQLLEPQKWVTPLLLLLDE